MRLLVADIAGVCDAGKTVADAATAEHGVNSAVGVGDHRNGILPAKAIQRVAGPRQDLVPVRGILRVLDQRIAHTIVQRTELLQQICMKGPPEAVVDSAAHQALIEFLLGAALERLPGLERGMLFGRQRSQHAGTVRKEQRVPYVEENEAALAHLSILSKMGPIEGTREAGYKFNRESSAKSM